VCLCVCMCGCVCVCVLVAGFYENVKKIKVCQEIPVSILSLLFPVAICIPVP